MSQPDGPESLRVVVEVRQVDQRQLGPLALEDLGGASGDPLACRAARHSGPQNVWNGKRPRSRSSRSHSPSGVPVMPKTLLPSAP